ncbi:winged helix-turn-helix transcriptional regulator [Actinoallomurus iriomotensis]|uniref:HxlR family transcriptional regulator n=1 Tax=Actinoallomurus iriomotensis TaxID=478107 RepID=A0A9W6S0H5_9ACTN|nr:helix-turn-helix domain-containing protein [Actinoallomurus iriomotensis]GLY83417.1 HxlR family transcriptional regulator [Actinoallomurus iriomotensis]
MAKVTPNSGSPRIREGGAVREVLDRIGDKWSLLVIGTLRAGPLRFGELEAAVAGISQRMLTLTLKHLVEDGLVARTAYAEVPPRVEYELTELGRTLVPLVMALAEWAMANREQINANRSGHAGGQGRP